MHPCREGSRAVLQEASAKQHVCKGHKSMLKLYWGLQRGQGTASLFTARNTPQVVPIVVL